MTMLLNEGTFNGLGSLDGNQMIGHNSEQIDKKIKNIIDKKDAEVKQMITIEDNQGHLNNDVTVDDLADAILTTVRNTDYRHVMVNKVKAVVNNSLRSRMVRLNDQIKEELKKQR